jgi:prepilin-type N-terminal cleavage/methylation domain-containing protein
MARALLFKWGDFNRMQCNRERGFSLIELAITVLVMGLVLAFGIPAFRSLSNSYQLHGAAENLAAQLRLAREKAISTGVEQPMHFVSSTTYHIHYPTGVATVWTLPKGITFASGVGTWFKMERDGRSNASGIVVLRDTRGNLDTVSVQLSGMVLTR